MRQPATLPSCHRPGRPGPCPLAARRPGREGYPGRFWLMVEAMSTIYRRIIELTRLKLSSIYHPTYIFRPAPQLLPLGRAENSQASGLYVLDQCYL